MLPRTRPRGALLRYQADRAAVAYVLSTFALRIGLWWGATPMVAAIAVLPLFFLGILAAPLNHHHQHVNTFRSRTLSRVYELVLALQTGAGPYTWVLHHNLGHHLNYLHQRPNSSPDESAWTRTDGSAMGRFEYSFRLFFSHHIDIYRVGKKYPRIYRAHLLMKIPLYALIALGLWLRPENMILVFLLPAGLTLLHTCWATYEHHAGLPTTSHFEATTNREHALYNVMSWNLGYHTAHHVQPGLHWSELPRFHEELRDQIPKERILTTFW